MLRMLSAAFNHTITNKAMARVFINCFLAFAVFHVQKIHPSTYLLLEEPLTGPAPTAFWITRSNATRMQFLSLKQRAIGVCKIVILTTGPSLYCLLWPFHLYLVTCLYCFSEAPWRGNVLSFPVMYGVATTAEALVFRPLDRYAKKAKDRAFGTLSLRIPC